MLKEVHLNLADRQLIARAISYNGVLNVETARVVREIRRRFELRESQKIVERMSSNDVFDKMQDVADELYEIVDKREDLDGGQKGWFLRQLTVNPGGALISWDTLSESEKRKFTIDDAFLSWLDERIDERDWSKIIDPRTGQEISLTINQEFAEAIANLSETVKNALA